MVLIQDRGNSGVSFWYPLGWRQGRRVRVVPWNIYRKWLPLRILGNVLLFCTGLLLLGDRLYTEDRYDLFAAAVLISGIARFRTFIPTAAIAVTPASSVRLLPSVLGDYSGTLLTIALMLFVFSVHGGALEFGVLPVVPCLLFVLFAAMPLGSAASLIVRRLKRARRESPVPHRGSGP